jgi:DNA polymerase-3 subunit delta'
MVPQEGSDQAANAFLKLLEEPPGNTSIILTSGEPGALLPTIRSRLVSFRMSGITETEMREFLRHPLVLQHGADAVRNLEKESDAMAALLREGAPGLLFAAAASRDAFQTARAFLADVTTGRTSANIKAAFALGASGARGGFSDFLDALTQVVHARVRQAVAENNHDGARAGAAAIAAIEDAKQLASGNVSPQLLGMKLARSLSGVPR